MVDYIADYLTNIRDRRVFPNVKPGYMRPLIDEEAPRHGEPWENIFNDIERVIMPGVSGCYVVSYVRHWNRSNLIRCALLSDTAQLSHYLMFFY